MFTLSFVALSSLLAGAVTALVLSSWHAETRRQWQEAQARVLADTKRYNARLVLVFRARRAMQDAGLDDVLASVPLAEMVDDARRWPDADLASIAALGDPVPGGG